MLLRHAFSVVTLVVAVVSLGGCANTPAVIVEGNTQSAPALLADRPVDVAVLPVDDATIIEGRRRRKIDLDMLRKDVADALPGKGYSPIGLEFVDSRLAGQLDTIRGHVAEASTAASIQGVVDEDAYLGVKLLQWDDSRLASRGRLKFRAEVLLTSSSDGERLWWGTIRGDLRAGGESGVVPTNTADKLASVSEMFGQVLLASLPPLAE